MNDDFEVLQHDWEFEQLLNLALRNLDGGAKTGRVLELGVWQGGTFQQWLSYGMNVIGVDINATENAVGIAGESPIRATLIEGNSHDDAIIGVVRALGPYDVVFVDADHSFAAASADWAIYSQMVKPGGIFAFHDIRRTEHATLDTLWNEIKRSGMPTTEFNKHDADWGGIGVVHF